MNAFNRVVVFLLSIGWCALSGGALLMAWDQGRAIDWRSSNLVLAFDFVLPTRAEQILLTIIAVALMLPALLLLVLEAVAVSERIESRPPGPAWTGVESESRRRSEAERRLEEERRRLDEERRKLDEERANARRAHAARPHEDAYRDRRWRFLPGRR
jgi:hypothetical protein